MWPPIQDGRSLKDPNAFSKQTYEMIYEVKLKEAMQECFKDLLKSAAIENQFVGTVKLANEEKDPSYGVDGNVKLMAGRGEDKGSDPKAAAAAAGNGVARAKLPTPVGLSPDAEKQFNRMQGPLKGRTGAPPSNAPTTAAPTSAATSSTTTSASPPSN